MFVEEHLTIEEVAERLRLKPKTVRNKMGSGIFRKGVHYYSPQASGHGSSGQRWLNGWNGRR